MVRMSMCCEDRRQSTAGRFEDPLDVHEIVRPRIDHCHALRADQISVRPWTGHKSRVARDQATHAWRDFVQLTGCERHGILAKSFEHSLVRLESGYDARC